MMDPFPWTCPYCNHDVIITDTNYSSEFHFFDERNKDGDLALYTRVIVCPNKDCREYAIWASLYEAERTGMYDCQARGEPFLSWPLKPQSQAKTYPPYIPKAIIDDYNEACLIKDLSPKASATLSRRCLQGMIRDSWGISKACLIDEINELEEKTDATTWKAIDAVRSIGNIGAHMERDINVIVDVEPEEAGLLIHLIEVLLKDWYIATYEREERLRQIVDVANDKKQDKKQ